MTIDVREPVKRGTNALRGAALATAMGYAGQVLSFVAVPIYLRTLGADNYGLMLAALSLSGYLSMSDGGLSWASMILMGHAYGRVNRSEMAHIFRHGMILAAISGLLAFGVAAAVWYMASILGLRLPMFVGHPSSDLLILIVGVQAAATPAIAMIYNVFYSVQEAQRPALYQGLARLIGTLSGILAALLWRKTWILLCCIVIVVLVMGMLAALELRRRHKWIFVIGPFDDTEQYRKQLRTGGKNFFLQLSKVLSGTAPILILSSISGPASVPLFTLSVTLFQVILSPLQSWASAAQTAYGEAWTAGCREWVVETFKRSMKNALLVAGLVVSAGVPLVRPAIEVISHGKLVLPPFMSLGIAVAGSIGLFVLLGQYLLTGLNFQRHAALGELANGIMGVVLGIAGVHWFGAAAAGWCFALASLLSSVWVLHREVWRRIGIYPFWFSKEVLGRTIIAVLFTSIAVRLIPDEIAANGYARCALLAVKAAIGFGTYACCAVFSGLLPRKDVKIFVKRLHINTRIK